MPLVIGVDPLQSEVVIREAGKYDKGSCYAAVTVSSSSGYPPLPRIDPATIPLTIPSVTPLYLRLDLSLLVAPIIASTVYYPK